MLDRLRALILPLAAGSALVACDMEPAEVLDRPRVLAIRTAPATLAPGEPHELSALLFGVDAELVWSACPVAWRPTDPPSCPDDDAVSLGRGNPLSTTLPADLDSLWLRVEPIDGAALPAMKRLVADVEAANPGVLGIAASSDDPPASPAVDVPVTLQVRLDGAADSSALVVSWYVTAGVLEPARTLASEPATLVADTPGPIEVYAVVRGTTGGTAWTSARFEVTP